MKTSTKIKKYIERNKYRENYKLQKELANQFLFVSQDEIMKIKKELR